MKEFVAVGETIGIVTFVARLAYDASLEAVGDQDLDTKTFMRTETTFRLASVTKPTCAGIMIRVDGGRVSLFDPVEKFLPEFKALKLNPRDQQLYGDGGGECSLNIGVVW
jgi:CubicO group peptidase (beta-lactamase class C family)